MNQHLVMVIGIAALMSSTANSSAQSDSSDRGFREVVSPLLQRHCAKCHSKSKSESEFRVDDLVGDWWHAREVNAWRKITLRLLLDEMPPDQEPRLDPALKQRALNWIVSGLRSIGVAPPGLDSPSDGNRIPHAMLFDCSNDAVVASPPRLWRLSPFLYDGVMRLKGVRGEELTQPFGSPPGQGLKDFASLGQIDEPTAGLLVRNASAIAAHQTRYTIENGKIKGFFLPRDIERLFDPAKPPPGDAEFTAAIQWQFRTVLQRSPSPDELARFLTLMQQNVKQTGLDQGVRTTFAAILLLPESLFRFELGQGDVDSHGRRMLSPRELAFAISFALTDRKPDGALMEAAEKGTLNSREQVGHHVQRLLNDSKVEKPRILRFFREFFGYADAVDVFKDDKEFKDHDAPVLVADTDRLIEHIVAQDRQVLFELLTTNKAFVNYRWDKNKKGNEARKANEGRKIHRSYGLPDDWSWTNNQPVELPADQRAGILTQPSWLVAHSLNAENHAIRRGKWVRERLLGGTVPDLPITVDAQLPETPDQTLRQRMEVTRQEHCWQCHSRMNPLGLAFEQFDHFGRFRHEELGKPVDSRGSIDRSGETTLDGPVQDSLEMIRKLAGSDRVRQVFIRHAFRYWMGRTELPSDACILVAADDAYRKSDGSFKALIHNLLTSDAFLYRWVAPSDAK